MIGPGNKKGYQSNHTKLFLAYEYMVRINPRTFSADMRENIFTT